VYKVKCWYVLGTFPFWRSTEFRESEIFERAYFWEKLIFIGVKFLEFVRHV